MALVTQMMAIPGKSGEERQIIEFIREKLLRAGAPESAISMDTAHRRSPNGGEIGNLIVKLPGSSRRPRRLLMAHHKWTTLFQHGLAPSAPVQHPTRLPGAKSAKTDPPCDPFTVGYYQPPDLSRAFAAILQCTTSYAGNEQRVEWYSLQQLSHVLMPPLYG